MSSSYFCDKQINLKLLDSNSDGVKIDDFSLSIYHIDLLSQSIGNNTETLFEGEIMRN